MEQLIFEKPALQPPGKRWLYRMAWIGFWALWFYLWLPLLTILGWSFGIYTGYEQMVLLDGLPELIRLLGWYAVIVLVIGAMLVAWAVREILGFQKRNERRTAPDLPPETMAALLKVPVDDLERIRSAKRLLVSHSADGTIAGVKIL